VVFAEKVGEPVVGQQACLGVLRKVPHLTQIPDYLE
jgi:hypothetical protein